MVESTEVQWTDAELSLIHIWSMERKLKAEKDYSEYRWTRIKAAASSIVLDLTAPALDKDYRRVDLAEEVQRFHLSVFGYSIKVITLFDGPLAYVFGVYEDPVIGDKWLFIANEDSGIIETELSMSACNIIRPKGFLMDIINVGSLESSIMLLVAIHSLKKNKNTAEVDI